MKKTLLSLLMTMTFSTSAYANSEVRTAIAQERLNNYSEAELSKIVFGKPYREFLQRVVIFNNVPEGATVIEMANAEGCAGLFDAGLCMEFAPTAAGIEDVIIETVIASVFPKSSNSNDKSDSKTQPVPILPTNPIYPEPIFGVEPIDPGFGADPIDVIVEPIDPGFGADPIDVIVEPIDPGFGADPIDVIVEPIDPGFGIEPIGEEEQAPVIGLGAFRAMSLEEQAQVLTQFINNSNGSSKGKVVVVDDKLMWETKDGKQKQLKNSNKVLDVLEKAHLERKERRDDRVKLDPIDVIIEPIDPGFDVDPIDTDKKVDAFNAAMAKRGLEANIYKNANGDYIISWTDGQGNSYARQLTAEEVAVRKAEFIEKVKESLYRVEPIDVIIEPIDPGFDVDPIDTDKKVDAFNAAMAKRGLEANIYKNANGDYIISWTDGQGNSYARQLTAEEVAVRKAEFIEKVKESLYRVEPIDVVIEPIDPGFGVDPLPPYDENAPIVSPILWGKNLETIKSWTGAINPKSLEAYKAMIAMANSPEGKIATLKMMLVNEISVDNILSVLAKNEDFVAKYPELFDGTDRFGNPVPSDELKKKVSEGRESQWQKHIDSYYNGIADLYNNIEDPDNQLKFATLLDSFMIGGSNKSLLDVMQGNGHLKDIPVGDRNKDLAGEILDKAKEHWLDNTKPGGRVISDAEKHALVLHRIFGKAGMDHLEITLVDGKIQVFNPNNRKILNEKQVMNKLVKAATKNAENRQANRDFEPGEYVDSIRELDREQQAAELNKLFEKAGFDVEVIYHNKKDEEPALVIAFPSETGKAPIYIEKSDVETAKEKAKGNVKGFSGQERRSDRRTKRHDSYQDRTPNHKSKFNGERLKKVVSERRNG
ncbi:hypothetical protein [Aliivibrio wodanis]|uniref:hypothetical protein n=1 Tax=Aliivibrio wodanis TaxID=80852 RepID=UPI00406C35E7